MSQAVQGTFSTGSSPAPGNASDSLVMPTSTTTMRLTVTGLDASNTVKTQKRTTPGAPWADQTTYNTDQTNAAVTVAAGEEWRVFQLTQQALRDVRYKLSAES